MTGILNVLMASGGGPFTDTFNFTVAVLPGSAFFGYGDGSSGTTAGAGGSMTGANLTGGTRIVEFSTSGSVTRLRIKGRSSDPGSGWLRSMVVNGHTPSGTLTYTWDATNLCATWEWNVGWSSIVNGNTYNGNTITHN